MPQLSSSERCDNAAKRIHERLGLWPKQIFTPGPHLSWSSSTALSLSYIFDLKPPEWSVGLLESLSRLADNFNPTQPTPALPHAAASQDPTDKSLLAARLSQALIEATLSDPKDVKEVWRKYVNEEEEEHNQIVVGEESDGDEGARESLEDQNTSEEEGDGTDDPDYEGSEAASNTKQSVGHADEANNQDQCIDSGDLACKTSLSAPFNALPTATSESRARGATGTTVNHNSGNVNGVRQSKPSSSHAFPETPTPGFVPLQFRPVEALRRLESPEHPHPAACSQSSTVPSKRPRLSSHSSGHSQFTDQPGSSDAQADLVHNNDRVNTHDVDMSSERHFIQQHLRLGDSPSSIFDNGAISAIAAIRQQSMRFNMAAAELQGTISRQRALNAADREAIARAEKSSDNISKSLASFSARLSMAEGAIKHIASAQGILQHSLDSLPKVDATRVHSDRSRSLFRGCTDELNHGLAEIELMKIHLAALQDKWRYFEQERAIAIHRYDQGVKATVATVAQHEDAIEMKKYWDLVAVAVRLGPKKLPRVMNSQSVAAEDWREAQVGVEQDAQEVAL